MSSLRSRLAFIRMIILSRARMNVNGSEIKRRFLKLSGLAKIFTQMSHALTKRLELFVEIHFYKCSES